MNNVRLNSIDNKCCGCSACADICPVGAIVMSPDQNGFLIPSINDSLCVDCQKCEKTCQLIHTIGLYKPIEAYVAKCNDHDALMRSASGGVFFSIANTVLANHGAVIGCSYDRIDDQLSVRHIVIQNSSEIKRIQGSKYVQSNTTGIYKQVKNLAINNQLVLFAGTPCQVAACRAYLGDTFENVFYVDIICHGVPSQDLFNKYISFLENKNRIKIDEIIFRDKSMGWDLRGSIVFQKNNKKYKKSFKTGSSSYYSLFLQSQTYRESCYECPYAGENRSGDITIGDYWGINEVHPELLRRNGGMFDEKEGISCLIINSERGILLVKKYGNNLVLKESEFSFVSKHNSQLREPSKKGCQRDEILSILNHKGYKDLDEWYCRRLGLKRLYYKLYDLIPPKRI